MMKINLFKFKYRFLGVLLVGFAASSSACSSDNDTPADGVGGAGNAGSSAGAGRAGAATKAGAAGLSDDAGSAGIVEDAGSGGLAEQAGSSGSAGHSGNAGHGGSAGSANGGGHGGVAGGGGIGGSAGHAGVAGSAGTGGVSGGIAGSGGGATCGLVLDSQSAPMVRFVNAHGPSIRAAADPKFRPELPLRLTVNGVPLAGLPDVSSPTAAAPEASVTPYVAIPAGNIKFGVQGGTGASAATQEAAELVAAKGERYTVITFGGQVILPSDVWVPETSSGTPLVVFKDDLASVPCDKARLRFFTADNANPFSAPTDPSALNALQTLYASGSTTAIGHSAPAAMGPEAGADVALTTNAFRVEPDGAGLAQPTGYYSFTAPGNFLLPGRTYEVLSLAVQSQGRTDDFGERLMFLPVGDNAAPTVLSIDPLIAFINVAPLPAAANLRVTGGVKPGINLLYVGSAAAQPNVNPNGGLGFAYVPPAGANLTFSALSDAATPLLTQASGALQRGKLYLGVISQSAVGAGQPLALTITKVEVASPVVPLVEPSDLKLPGPEYIQFINGLQNSPPFGFGSFVGTPSQFTAVVNSVAYGATSSSAQLPIAYQEAVANPNVFGGFDYFARLGIQVGADATTNRSVTAQNPKFPRKGSNVYVYVAAGNWTDVDSQKLYGFEFAGTTAFSMGFALPLK